MDLFKVDQPNDPKNTQCDRKPRNWERQKTFHKLRNLNQAALELQQAVRISGISAIQNRGAKRQILII